MLSNLPATKANAVQIAALYQKRWRIERLFQVLEQCFRGEINQAGMQSVHRADKIEARISPYYLADEVRRVYEGMMIAIPTLQWQPFAQLDVDATVQLLQQLAAQMELSKFRSHSRGEKKKIPKPKRQKDKPHVSTARLPRESKSKKDKKAP